MVKLTHIIFDWGNTIMRDHGLPGPMKDWDNVENIEGIEKVLEELHKNFILIIATSADHSNTADMKAALKRVGVDHFFKYFFSSKDLGAAKPHPDFFLKILQQLGCEPNSVLSVGDRYLNDVVAAKRAGLHTIWFNEKRKSCEHPDADAVIFTMPELPASLELL